MRILSFSLAVALALAGLAASGCKTPGKRASLNSADAPGDKAAADRFIVGVIGKAYPDTAKSPEVVGQFAAALQDPATEQSESAAYVLTAFTDEAKAGTLASPRSPIQQYVLEQFLTLTNYMAVKVGRDSALALTLPVSPK